MAVVVSGVVHSADVPMRTSIRSIVSHPSEFDQKSIQVRAVVRSDRRHLVLLYGIEGADPDQGVALMIPESVRSDVAVAALMRAIYQGAPGDMRKKVTATVTGLFEWHPRKVPSRVLVLAAVSDMTIAETNP